VFWRGKGAGCRFGVPEKVQAVLTRRKGLALNASRLIEPLLFEASPRNPLVFTLVATVPLVVALVASVIPGVVCLTSRSHRGAQDGMTRP
jgi:hypothetical protein